MDDLRALNAATAFGDKFNVAKWARARSLNSSTVRELVRDGVLTPEAQNRLNRAEGKAPSLRQVEIDDLRALSDALARDPKLNVTEWARARSLNFSTVKKLVQGGALTPEAQNRLNRGDGKAPSLRQVEIDDLRALSDALARDPKLNVTEWARARSLNFSTVREFVRDGALTSVAWERLRVAGC
ncbi:hypothetical protein [Pandoraea horticolens]|uniref:hypothetical protein n=1 Tax=Pandoraea horticolens TaxID=2508298 RepID=UPI0012400806|nr:hypothetical protein [Pandoraea horticolens]